VRVDPSLAFRFSCINANACKECMMLIDGTSVSLRSPTEEGATTLAPLPKKALIRDLVTRSRPRRATLAATVTTAQEIRVFEASETASEQKPLRRSD